MSKNKPPSADGINFDYLKPIAVILDSLDALVYVADFDTYELLYLNAYGRTVWGDIEGSKCWQTLQAGQTRPCEFCTNHRLRGPDGKPTGVYVWEFQNTVTQRWFQCRDQAIRWPDGRLVRLEVATDITERKVMEEQLREAAKQAEERANTDELTGLSNRRAFFSLGTKTVSQALRANLPLALLMFDIDHFKQINDSFGHAIGDQVLKRLANHLAPLVRDADVFARIGGEEFAVLMTNSGLVDALFLAERLRSAVEQLTIPIDGHSLSCTSSFGIAINDGRTVTLEKLLSEADHAMYRAKDGGRNRVAPPASIIQSSP